MTRREQLNAQRVGTLHHEFIPLVEEFLARVEATGARPLIVQARRTIAEQDALYAKGRTAPGPIVTKARGGRSKHNFGLAIDIIDLGASGDPDKYEESDWEATNYASWQKIGLSLGLMWGGSWRTFQDRPHFEWSPLFGTDALPLMQYADAEGFLPPDFFQERTA